VADLRGGQWVMPTPKLMIIFKYVPPDGSSGIRILLNSISAGAPQSATLISRLQPILWRQSVHAHTVDLKPGNKYVKTLDVRLTVVVSVVRVVLVHTKRTTAFDLLSCHTNKPVD